MGSTPTSSAPSTPVLSDFATLLDSCQWPLYIFLRRLLSDDELARDLVQDTFCTAWQVAQRGAPPFHDLAAEAASVRRWLFHAAYNRAISALRHRRLIVWRSLDAAALDPGETAVQSSAFEDEVAEAQAVRAALDTLSPSDAACLLLIAVHDFTAAEVGEIVGASAQAVAKRFARAKRRLRDTYVAQNAVRERTRP